MKSTVFENEDYSTQNQLTKIYINSLVNNEKQSHCIYHIKNNIQTNTQKEKHSHSRWLECVQNMQNKKKTAWITPTNDEAKLKLSKQNVTAVNLLRQQQNKEENNNV